MHRRANFLCDRSDGGLRRSRSEVDQSLVVGPGPCARPYVVGTCRHIDQARRRRASPNANMRWRWIEISPHAHAIIGLGKIFIGRAEETEAHIGEALRLSPRDTLAYIWMTYRGLAKLHLGSCEQAVAWFRRAIEANRNFPTAYFLSGRRSRAARSTRRGAFRCQGRPRARPDLHRLARPRRLDGDERRPDLSGPA